METLPDLVLLSDAELSALLASIEDGEDAISRRRRVLHGRIDILRAERIERLRAHVARRKLRGQAADVVGAPDYEGTGEVPDDADLTPLPDLAELSDEALWAAIRALEHEEDDISLNRRVMHGQIDIIRAERAKRRAAASMSTPAISARSSAGGNEPHLLPGVRIPEPRGRDVLLPVRCPAGPRDRRRDDVSLGPEEIEAASLADNIDGPARLVRSGGGGAGESFEAIGDQALIGRSPECDVFLDDVTVSRRHAELTRDGKVFTSAISGASTAPSSTGGASRAACWRTTTRFRSANTG